MTLDGIQENIVKITANPLEWLYSSPFARRLINPSAIVFGISFIFVSATSQATVIEYGDDGTPIVHHLSTPEQSQPLAETPVPIPSPLAPRQLGKLTTEQLIYRKLANETALRYAGSKGVVSAGLDTLTFIDVFVGLIRQESNFDPKAVSPKGAQGLGQIIPATAKDLGLSDPFYARANLDASARYFISLLDQFGSVDLALAAYNAGPERVKEYNGIPPFPETRQYVIDVLDSAGLETDISAFNTGKTQSAPTTTTNQNQPVQGVQSVWEY